ncbi:MAG TPA: hypothetical protein VFE32_01310 [Puia sp.]|jgi:hypothetical protein|nr:hypothetical protein [Puia sp.]
MSTAEYKDYKRSGALRIQDWTLEAKQFFKTRVAVEDFIQMASSLRPPYTRVLIFDLDSNCFKHEIDERPLDGHMAVTITAEHLEDLNNCITFEDEYAI